MVVQSSQLHQFILVQQCVALCTKIAENLAKIFGGDGRLGTQRQFLSATAWDQNNSPPKGRAQPAPRPFELLGCGPRRLTSARTGFVAGSKRNGVFRLRQNNPRNVPPPAI